MNRKHCRAVLEHDERLSLATMKQEASDRCGSMVGQKTRGQHHADSSAATREPNRPLEKRLVEVDVAGGLRLIRAGIFDEPRLLIRRATIAGKSWVGSEHVPGGVAENRVEAGLRHRFAVGFVERFR